MSNHLIVESENDKYFVEALLSHLHPNCNGLQVEELKDSKFNALEYLINALVALKNQAMQEGFEKICPLIDEAWFSYCHPNFNVDKLLGGSDKDKLIKALVDLKNRAMKEGIEKIGIILDQDNKTEENRIDDLVNSAIADPKAFNTQIKISATAQFVKVPVDDHLTVELACYFTNVNGQGELETVLKAIKNKESVYADCLEAWRNCLETNGEELSDKEFDKFWVSNYHRFDCCSKKEKKQADSKCGHKNSFRKKIDGKQIYNFDSPVLDGLKEFLNLFVFV